MSRRRKPSHPNLPLLRSGDHVLMGGSHASFPSDWYLAQVIWSDGIDVLLHRSSPGTSEYYRQVDSILSVRAVGTIAELGLIKEQARKAVHALQSTVHDAEQALGAARAAVHAELERLAKGGLTIIPRDHEAIAQDKAAVRAAVEVIDHENITMAGEVTP